jgi:hypothetical protein
MTARTARGIVAWSLLPAALAGQVRASERASVSQTVDGTTITIEYSRPVARGRDSLFGRVVRWGDVWTPGANWATTLELSRDARLGGERVRRGTYSVWMIPRAEGEWTLFLSTDHRRFHTRRPDPQSASVSLRLAPVRVEHVEVLTWEFPLVTAEGTTLRMAWGTTAVTVPIAVDATGPPARRANLAPYLGTYRVTVERAQGDSVAPFEVTLELFERDGHLRGRVRPRWAATDPEFDLLPAGEHRFTGRYYRAGQVFDQDQETEFVFVVAEGRARSFEMRTEDVVFARGRRP